MLMVLLFVADLCCFYYNSYRGKLSGLVLWFENFVFFFLNLIGIGIQFVLYEFLHIACMFDLELLSFDFLVQQLGFMLLALIWKFDFPPFMVLIIAILNDGSYLLYHSLCVPSGSSNDRLN